MSRINMHINFATSSPCMRITYQAKPFPHMIVDGLLDKATLGETLQATRTLYFSRKESDLFSFEQSPDLTNSNHPGIEGAQRAIKGLIPLAQKRFGGRLTRLDMSGMRFTDTDYLLCHDDRLERRKVAYILYLSDVKQKDGGALLLRSIRKPYRVLAKITPKMNRLVLFQVSSKSWHEVDEVRGTHAVRLSLGGWLHA